MVDMVPRAPSAPTSLAYPTGIKRHRRDSTPSDMSSLVSLSPAKVTQTEPRAAAELRAPTTAREEPRGAYRTRSIEAIEEAKGDVGAFLQELETKRRQLDDQIHRYIKQKEREYKLFERDLRVKYRTPQHANASHVQEGSPSSGRLDGNTGNDTENDVIAGDANVRQQLEKEGTVGKEETLPEGTDDGLESSQATKKRESELLGFFTPAYLPLLDVAAKSDGKPPSAPTTPSNSSSLNPELKDNKFLQRAQSDPVVVLSALANRPNGFKLEHRTPSTGSEKGRSLISALKPSPSTRSRGMQKRVSLVVGDEVVAPSDNVFEHAEHIEIREEIVERAVAQPSAVVDQSPEVKGPSEPALTIGHRGVSEVAPLTAQRHSIIASKFKSPSPEASEMAPNKAAETIVAEPEDLSSPFTMDEEIQGPPPPNADDDNDDEGEDEDETEGPMRDEPVPRQRNYSTPTNEDLNAHLASERQSEKQSALSAQLKTSPGSASQPVTAGFSRPSARRDPYTYFVTGSTPEVEDNAKYGSFSSRADPYNMNTGSLGESFMMKHAEKMLERRLSGSGKS